MNKNRPVNLDLGTLKFPPMAISSILHRISGILIFLLLPFALYLLSQSLETEQTYLTLVAFMQNPLIKLFTWGGLAAIIFHLVAGIRHMLMDLGYGESLEGGRRGALIVMGLSALLIILTGVWLW